MKGPKTGIVFLGLLCSALIFVFKLGSMWTENQIYYAQVAQEANVARMEQEKKVEPTTPDPGFLLPSDEQIDALDDNQLMKVYWQYVQQFQVICKSVIRVGNMKDGGKEVCVEPKYRPQEPCLVYSFGSNNDFSFDRDIVKLFGCDVHVFDPSLRKPSYKVADRIWFHNWGLGNVNAVNAQKWEMKTLDVVMKELGHTNKTLDILKIDIEGDEWRAIPQMVATDVLKYARQILLETHFGRQKVGRPFWGSSQDLGSRDHMKAFRQLYEAGFRMFMREKNLWSLQIWPGIEGQMTNVNEISLVKP